MVYTYDLERTICDLIMKRKRDEKTVNEEYCVNILKLCINTSNFSIQKLREYAEKLNISKEVDDILLEKEGR
jgi:hypothetical protein